MIIFLNYIFFIFWLWNFLYSFFLFAIRCGQNLHTSVKVVTWSATRSVQIRHKSTFRVTGERNENRFEWRSIMDLLACAFHKYKMLERLKQDLCFTFINKKIWYERDKNNIFLTLCNDLIIIVSDHSCEVRPNWWIWCQKHHVFLISHHFCMWHGTDRSSDNFLVALVEILCVVPEGCEISRISIKICNCWVSFNKSKFETSFILGKAKESTRYLLCFRPVGCKFLFGHIL